MVEEKMHRDFISPTVKGSDIEFRSGTKKLFEECDRLKIPLLVFSAGLTSKDPDR